jgi:hypothetical protein
MKKNTPIYISLLVLILSLACVLNRFSRRLVSTSIPPLATLTSSDYIFQVTPSKIMLPSITPTLAIRSESSTATVALSTNSNPTLSPTNNIGIAFNCADLISIEILSFPHYYNYLNLQKAKGIWLVLHLRLTNLTSDTFNYLHENDFSLMYLNSDLTTQIFSTQSADVEAYLVWAYSAYLVDPLPGAGTSQRVVAFDVDPAIKDWTLIFNPKNSVYSPNPFCTLEIPLP